MARERITQAMLDRKVRRLNELVGANPEPYTKKESGEWVDNAGSYYVGGAYGGWKVELMVEGGGSRIPAGLDTGFVPRRKVYDALCAYIAGVVTGQRVTA